MTSNWDPETNLLQNVTKARDFLNSSCIIALINDNNIAIILVITQMIFFSQTGQIFRELLPTHTVNVWELFGPGLFTGQMTLLSLGQQRQSAG